MRIYPAYWITIVLTLVVFSQVIPYFTVLEYIKLFTGFQAFDNDFTGGGLYWFWFIGLIVSLYLLFPLLVILMRKHPHVTILSFLVVEFSSRIIVSQTPWMSYGIYWFPLCRFFEFGLGIYLTQVGFYVKKVSSNLIAFSSDMSFYVYLTHVLALLILLHSYVIYAIAVTVLTGMLYTFDNNIRQLISRRQVKTIKNKEIGSQYL